MRRRYEGVGCVALASLQGHAVRAAPPPTATSARLAVDLVVPTNAKYRPLWSDLLRDALVFDTEQDLVQYKAQHGFGRHLVAKMADGGWRVVSGSSWEVRGTGLS